MIKKTNVSKVILMIGLMLAISALAIPASARLTISEPAPALSGVSEIDIGIADFFKTYQSYDQKLIRVVPVRSPTDDVSFTGDVDNYRYLMYYYPNAKGTRTFQIRHESPIYWDKVAVVEAFWSSDGKKWNKFTQQAVNFYPFWKRISLYSGSPNIRYMFLVGVFDQPNGPDILTFHAKFY